MKFPNFNTYYENIDYNFWRNLCVEKGELRHYEKGELFAEEGRISHFPSMAKKSRVSIVAVTPCEIYSLSAKEQPENMIIRISDITNSISRSK